MKASKTHNSVTSPVHHHKNKNIIRPRIHKTTIIKTNILKQKLKKIQEIMVNDERKENKK